MFWINYFFSVFADRCSRTFLSQFRNPYKNYRNYKSYEILFYSALFCRVSKIQSRNLSKRFRLSLILIDSFIWLVCRVEPMEAKLVAIAGGPAVFTVLPADDLKNRA